MTQSADLPLDPISPQPAAPRNLVLLVILAVLSLLLWLAVAWQVLFTVPRFHRLFAEFHMKLPWVSEQVIKGNGWIAPALAFAALLTCLTTRSRWAWLFLLLLLPLFLNVFISLSLYFPFMALVDGLGGQAPNF